MCFGLVATNCGKSSTISSRILRNSSRRRYLNKIHKIKHQNSMDYWKQVFIAPQQSGLDATEYCRRQDIKYGDICSVRDCMPKCIH